MGPWARPAFLSEKYMVKSDPPEQQDFPGGPDGKALPTMWEIWVQFQGREDPLEKEMATHSSTVAWKIPRTEEPGRLQSMGVTKSRT